VLVDVADEDVLVDGNAPISDILPKPHFIRELQREKVRADRSKAPLSVALFGASATTGHVEEFLTILYTNKRATDVIGYLSKDCVAVLLPETSPEGARRQTQRILDRVGEMPVSPVTRTYPDELFDHLLAERQPLDNFYPFYVQEGLEEQGRTAYTLKRTLDVLGALAAIVALAPLMVATAIAVRLSSPGPVIFKQLRLGRRGVPFAFYKFRSMYCNADDRIHRDYVATLIKGDLGQANQGDGEKPLFKLKADPRITRVGRFIRKTSIDELPQLFNVLKGDMSLVGPRPPVLYEVEKYQSWHLRRILEARPGITGLWQVEGRSTTSFDEMVRLDLRYISKCSLLMDLKILVKTVKVVLRCDGAK
jgi:exopolysaccharide biosynthesis polyprenyl glycosylphosphotransferase